LTSIVLIPAILAEPAGFRAIRDHVTRIIVAFSPVGPLLASLILVHAIFAIATTFTTSSSATTTTITSVTTVTSTFAVASFGSAAVPKIAFDQIFSEDSSIALASRGTVDADARPLRAGCWALALAEMVDVTRFLTRFILVAMSIAFVHDVDNLGVGEMQGWIRTMPDAALVFLISRYDCKSPVGGEGFSSVVHDGAVVVRDSKMVCPSLDVEVVSVFVAHVVEENFDCCVPVHATLLVMKTDGVSKFVSRDAVNGAATDSERHFVIAMKPTDHGVTTAFIDNRDIIAMSGRLGQRTTGRSETNTCLLLPLLHGTQDDVGVSGPELSRYFIWNDGFGPPPIRVLHTRASEGGEALVGVGEGVLNGV